MAVAAGVARPTMAGAIPIGPGRGRCGSRARPDHGAVAATHRHPAGAELRDPRHGWSGSRSRAATIRSWARCGARHRAGHADGSPLQAGSPATPALAPGAGPGARDRDGRRRRRTDRRDHRGRPCSSGPVPRRSPGGGRSDRRRATPAATDRCAEERRLAEERCELATRARAQADAAVDALRVAQRSYDEHEAAAVTAAWKADPRAVHDAKDAAQGGFRSAVAAATSPDQLEAAARDWLTEINRINNEAREATTTAAREHAAAQRDRCDPRTSRARGRLGPDLGRQRRCDLSRRPRGRRRVRRAPGRGSVELPRPARRGRRPGCRGSTRTRRSARRSRPAASRASSGSCAAIARR